MEISKEAFGMIGTIIGAGIALSGAIVTAVVGPRVQRRLETAKLQAARTDSVNQQLQARIQQLACDFASAGHSMCWIIWMANQDALSDKTIATYDQEMHMLLPRISGGIVSVAALDEQMSLLAQGMARSLYNLDARIGQACVKFTKDPMGTRASLARLADEVGKFEGDIVPTLGAAARSKMVQLLDMPLFATSRRPN